MLTQCHFPVGAELSPCLMNPSESHKGWRGHRAHPHGSWGLVVQHTVRAQDPLAIFAQCVQNLATAWVLESDSLGCIDSDTSSCGTVSHLGKRQTCPASAPGVFHIDHDLEGESTCSHNQANRLPHNTSPCSQRPSAQGVM